MKKTLFISIYLLSASAVFSQVTLIPDIEFETRLVAQGIDSDGTINGQVLTDDIDHITILDVSTSTFSTDYILNLTGIEDFVALEDLQLFNNELETIDLSNNTNLKLLNCKQNNLTSLDVSNNIMLELIDAANCFPGTCTQENTFASIDLSNNINLKSFGIFYNNTISQMDFNNNPLLESVTIVGLTLIDYLNIKNGGNINLTNLNILDNPNLGCIEVDDPVAATQGTMPPYNNWNVEESVIFADNCTLSIPYHALGQLIALYPNPADKRLLISNNSPYSIETITFYDMMGRQVLEEKEMVAQIDIATLQSGPYLVKIETGHGVLHKKIIKN